MTDRRAWIDSRGSFLLLVVGIACSGSRSGTPTRPDSAGGAEIAQDAASSDGSAPVADAEAPESGPDAPRQQADFMEGDVTAGIPSPNFGELTTLNAAFVRRPGVTAVHVQEQAGCVLTILTGDADGPRVALDAGPVELTFAPEGGQLETYKLSFVATQGYAGQSVQGWPMTPIMVHVVGGTGIAGFDATAGVPLETLHVTSPGGLGALGTEITISRADSTSIQWGPLAAGTVVVTIVQYVPNAERRLRCVFPASDGAAEIAPASKQFLTPGANTSLIIESAEEQHLSVSSASGPVDITVRGLGLVEDDQHRHVASPTSVVVE